MKERSSHKLIWFELGVLLMLFALKTLWMPTPRSTAQQDNRQLNREQAQQSNLASERRIALVIGNGAYTGAPSLKNPPNDARDMAATLKILGFEVASGVNVNQREMKRLIREFGQWLKGGGSGLFYYAGHGVQSKGRNYLIPVDADIQSEAEVEDSGIDAGLVLNYMDDAQNGLNIVILDACRNNPFARSFRSASDGLAQVDAPTGTLIAYATAPGRVASDGTGQNGLYTSELLKQMLVPDLSVTEMFMRVRANVMKQTANKQVPWEASSLVGTFYFREPIKSLSVPTTIKGANEAKIEPVAVEREHWETIRNSNDVQDYKDYLQTYPNGVYAGIALAKIRQIQTSKNEAANSGSPNPEAETPLNSKWQKYSPKGEAFSVSMPKEPRSESARSVYQGSIVNRDVYRSEVGNRPFFAVMSAGGIQFRASQSYDKQMLDSYSNAFKYWLPEAVLGKARPIAELTLIGEISLNGNPGREYSVVIGDSTGIARVYVTEKRSYIIVILGASNSSDVTKNFLDSFVLQPRPH